MKKILCVILATIITAAALPAFAAHYEDVSMLPAHVRWAEKMLADGEYGDEVHQFFFSEPVSGYHYNVLLYYEDGQPKLHHILTDSGGNPNDPLYYRQYGYRAPSDLLCAFINGGGFDDLADYEGDGDIDVCYAHITSGGVDYMQLDGFDSDSTYYPIIMQVLKDTSLYDSIKSYREKYKFQTDPWIDSYEKGELGDEVFVLTQFSTWNGDEPIIGLISIKDGKAVIATDSGSRELTSDELTRLRSFVEVNGFDALPSYNNPGAYDGGGYRYYHLTPEGKKFLQAKNAFMDTAGSDSAVYAEFEMMVKEFCNTGVFRPSTETDMTPWIGSAEPPINSVSITVNGLSAGSGVYMDGSVTAPLNKGLLDALGIKRTKRPDMSTVVLSRGTKLVMYEPSQSYITVVDAAGYDDPAALAEALSAPDAYENGAARVLPIGYSVAYERLPFDAVCDAFGLECRLDGGEASVTAPPVENLDPEYVKTLVGYLMK